MNTTEKKTAPRLSLRERETEKAACEKWINETKPDAAAAERETVQKIWLTLAERKKAAPFLTDKEKESVLHDKTRFDVAGKIQSLSGVDVAADDPVLIAALGGIALHEELQKRQILILERFLDKLEKQNEQMEFLANQLDANRKNLNGISTVFSKMEQQIEAYNKKAAAISEKHGQILMVGSSSVSNRNFYALCVVMVVLFALLVVAVFKSF